MERKKGGISIMKCLGGDSNLVETFIVFYLRISNIYTMYFDYIIPIPLLTPP